ncbi:hypothetical protein E4U57_006016, partial [Claviceps arundinis]
MLFSGARVSGVACVANGELRSKPCLDAHPGHLDPALFAGTMVDDGCYSCWSGHQLAGCRSNVVQGGLPASGSDDGGDWPELGCPPLAPSSSSANGFVVSREPAGRPRSGVRLTAGAIGKFTRLKRRGHFS